MIEEIYNYFTIEMLYYWVNLGVLPFWFVLIFFPRSNISKYFITSIFPILILSGAYIFILYKSYLGSYDFVKNFNLYLGIDSVSELFTNKSYIMMFWIHFVSINLFTGGWIVKDSQKFAKRYHSDPPPKHLINAATNLMNKFGYGHGYEYDHDTKSGFSGQNYFPVGMKRQLFYHPVDRGLEREFKKRISYFSKLRSHLEKKPRK